MRLLTLSDSDSYLKWAVGLTATAEWGVRHLVLDNVLAPSDAQIRAILDDYPGRPVHRVAAVCLAGAIRRAAPDAILLACTGPALEAVLDLLRAGGILGAGRPVLATGLPGISYPANQLAVHHRRDCDLMVLHSHREREAYARIVGETGGPAVALGSLPFLATVAKTDPEGTAVVFAAQSLVPPRADQRRAILTALAGLPGHLQPVVKIRAVAGERQAHNEALPYQELWAEMEQPRDITFRAGSMAAALRDAAGFVTVSSTAALEALAAGVPTLVLDEFGVAEELINTVFVDSGLLGGLDKLVAGEFATPRPDWLTANYFHPRRDNDWARRLEQLVVLRRAGGLPGIRRAPEPWRRRVRRQLRVLPPRWVWDAVARVRR